MSDANFVQDPSMEFMVSLPVITKPNFRVIRVFTTGSSQVTITCDHLHLFRAYMSSLAIKKKTETLTDTEVQILTLLHKLESETQG